jgi:hypothetical protein
MRRQSSTPWFFLLAAFVLFSEAGCGKSEGGTYVKLRFKGTVDTSKPIHSIAVNLRFDSGAVASTSFEKANGTDIVLETTAVLEIGTGQGPLTVSATALAADQTPLGYGVGVGTVERDTTKEITVTFSQVVADGGVDGPLGIDGPAPIDVTLDTTARDTTADSPTDAPAAPDTPIVLDGSVDSGADLSGIGGEVKVDAPGTGGIGGVDAGGVGGTGGVGGAGGAGGTSRAGGSTGSGGTATDGGPTGYLLVANPPSYTFGVILPGNTSPPQTFTILNKGNDPAPPLGVTIDDKKSFPLVQDSCTAVSLKPGGSCTVAIAFSPGAMGPMQTNATIAPAGGPGVVIQLSGSGAGGPATLTLTPPSVTLPLTDVNTTASANFTLTNGGDSEAGTITIQVPGAPVFQLTANGCGSGSLGGRSQCLFTVTFAPNTFGPASTTVTVRSSLQLQASATISGTGRDYMTLRIDFNGDGKGKVTGGPQDCPSGPMCTFNIARTDPSAIPQYVLTAQPEPFTTFESWDGDCASAGNGPCTVVMDNPHTAIARFTRQMARLSLSVLSISGHTGKLVSGDGNVSCSSDCPNLLVPATDKFVLNAVPDGTTMTFAGWTSGACHGANPSCTFPLTSTQSVVGTFGPQSYMFVTSTTVAPGDLSGLDGADKRCNTLAETAGLTGTYAAWLSTGSPLVPAGGRVGGGGWLRTDGRPFAHDVRSLTDPSSYAVLYPPRINERGEDLGNGHIPVATGTGPDGNPLGKEWCANYTDPKAGSLYLGDAAAGSVQWTNKALDTAACGNPQHIYCFRTDLRAGTLDPPTFPDGRTLPGRRIFASATAYKVGGTIAPNDVCGKDADAGGIGDPSTFVAFLAYPSARAIDLIDGKSLLPWRRMDGVFIVEQPGDLAAGKLIAPIDALANGKSYLTGNAWSGARDPVTAGADGSTCGGWKGGSTSLPAPAGDSATTAKMEWFNSGNVACTSTDTRLICIEP